MEERFQGSSHSSSSASATLVSSRPGYFFDESHESLQQAFLNAILHHQHVIGCFPSRFPLATLYALPAFSWQRFGLIVSPNRWTIQKQKELFQKQGVHFPTVAILDGSQPPHGEREILEQIKHQQVRLLYVTPEKFASVPFLQWLIHMPVGFLVIEEAQRFLEGFPQSTMDLKVLRSLNAIRKKPPIALMTQPISERQRQELAENLYLGPYVSLERSFVLQKTQIDVRCFLTEQQKLTALFKLLHGEIKKRSKPKRTWALSEPIGPALIRTHHWKTAERLSRTLILNNIESVYTYHQRLPFEELQTIERRLVHEPGSVVVADHGIEPLLLQPFQEKFRLIYWHPTYHLTKLAGEMFQAFEDTAPQIEGTILYTKEDYAYHRKRLLSREWHSEDVGMDQRLRQEIKALDDFRRWILSNRCRIEALLLQCDLNPTRSLGEEDFSPCGICDSCQSPPSARLFDGRIGQFIKRWFY